MLGIGFVGQNLCLAYVMLNKTYSWHIMLDKTYSRHRLSSTKPIPGIRYVGQNHILDLTVKICKTRCFPSKKIFSEIK